MVSDAEIRSISPTGIRRFRPSLMLRTPVGHPPLLRWLLLLAVAAPQTKSRLRSNPALQRLSGYNAR